MCEEQNNVKKEEENFDALSLEELFIKLEEVSKKLEEPDTPLEESFSLYHKGMQMLKACNERIDRAEKQMIVLEEESSYDEI